MAQCSGRECGPDGCGGVCGLGCMNGESCVSGQCETACVAQCAGRQCGPDGCSGTCGTCAGGASCEAGACVSACTPACDGKVCGDDGCGASCGTCESGATCDASGLCVGVVITSISPAVGRSGIQTPVSIIGQGFEDGARVKLGGRDLEGVEFTGASLISAVVPADLVPGRYTVIVVNPGGELAQLTDGFEVQAVTATTITGDEAGCSASGPGAMLGAFGFWIMSAFAGLVFARRRH